MKDYSFGNNICALRMSRGLSQFQLGTLIGVTDKAVSKWENGDAKPRIATCHRLAKALGVNISELLSCEQYFTKPARKEFDNMNKQLWEQAYQRLYEIYGSNPPVQCLERYQRGVDIARCFRLWSRFTCDGKYEERPIF